MSDGVTRCRWVDIPVIAAVVVGAVCAGVGVGCAATATDDGSGFAGSRYPWSVRNATGKTVNWGQFCKVEIPIPSELPAPHSALEFGTGTPWASLKAGEQTAEAFQPYPMNPVGLPRGSYTSGIIDIDGDLWVPRAMPWQHLRARKYYTPGSDWHRMWIFWDATTDSPFLTKDGAGEDIPLERVSGDRYGSENECTGM